jgi:hypothetical protein
LSKAFPFRVVLFAHFKRGEREVMQRAQALDAARDEQF